MVESAARITSLEDGGVSIELLQLRLKFRHGRGRRRSLRRDSPAPVGTHRRKNKDWSVEGTGLRLWESGSDVCRQVHALE